MKSYCGYCEKDAEFDEVDGSLYCSVCGHSISTGASAKITQIKNHKRQKLKLFLISLSRSLLFFSLGAVFLFFIVGETSESIRLSKSGVESIGFIKETKVVSRGHGFRRHMAKESLVVYDGHEKKMFLGSTSQVGIRFYVVYDQDDPWKVRVGRRSDVEGDVWSYIQNHLFECVMGLGGIIYGVYGLFATILEWNKS